MTKESEISLLTPLKYMGLYTEGTLPKDILESFNKEEVELAFAKIVRLERKDETGVSSEFIMAYGRFFRDCPPFLDFEFLGKSGFYFYTKLQSPVQVSLSAILYNEILIHKLKQNPSEDISELKKSIETLKLLDQASESQDGLSLPPSYARLFKESAKHAQMFPYEKRSTETSLENIYLAPGMSSTSTDHHGPFCNPIPTESLGTPFNSMDTDGPDPLINAPDPFNSVRSDLSFSNVVTGSFSDLPLFTSMGTGVENAQPSSVCDGVSLRKKVRVNWDDVPPVDKSDKDENERLNDKVKSKEDNDKVKSKEDNDKVKSKEDNDKVKSKEDNEEWTTVTKKVKKKKRELNKSNEKIKTGNKLSRKKRLQNKNASTTFENKRRDNIDDETKGYYHSTLQSTDKSSHGKINWDEIPGVDKNLESEMLNDYDRDSIDELDKVDNEDTKSSNSTLDMTEESKTNVQNVFESHMSALTEGEPHGSTPRNCVIDLTVDTENSDVECSSTNSNVNRMFSNSEDEVLNKITNKKLSVDKLDSEKLGETNAKPPIDNVKNNQIKKKKPSEDKLDCEKLLKRDAQYIIDEIETQGLGPIYTDSRNALVLYLIANDKVNVEPNKLEHLEKLEEQTPRRYFSILESCFKKWPNKENAKKEQTDYGSKEVVFENDGPNTFIKTRNYKKRQKCRSTKVLENSISIYYCEGGEVCVNEKCLFKQTYEDENLVTEKRNTTQFIAEERNNVTETFCLYCKTDGYTESTIENLSCNARLYWNKNTNIVFMLNSHSCFPIYRRETPSSFREDFDRNLGYTAAVKHNIRKQLESGQNSVEEIVKGASKFSVGSRQGSQAKIELIGRPSPVKVRVDETIAKLKLLDENFILEHTSNCIVTSSSKSLATALKFDINYGIFEEPGFLDVCFSRVLGSSWVACSVYFYHPVGRAVIKVATGYIPSENTESVCQVLVAFNNAMGRVLEKQGKVIPEGGFRLRPRQIFIDFNDVNRNAFIAAGYPLEEINQMLEGCGKHFRDMTEQVKVPFKGQDKQIIETYLFDWKNCIFIDKMETHFDTIRAFVIRKVKNTETRDEILCKLKWWKDRQPSWSKAYSSLKVLLKHCDSNLSEVGHSPSLKNSSLDDAMIDDVVTYLHQDARLIAGGNGSLKAFGAGPDYEKIQNLKRSDLDEKLTQIGNEVQNPSLPISDDNLEDVDLDAEILVPETRSETTSVPVPRETISVPVPRKRSVRPVKSKEFKTNHTMARKLNVSVRQVLVDTSVKKEIKASVSKQYGRYSQGELITISFESVPHCSCQYCNKVSSRNGRREVCPPQIWMRQNLLGMSDECVQINQVYFSPEEAENVLRGWRPPVIDSEIDLREMFERLERKYPKENMKYFLEKTSVHTTRRRCFGSTHGIYGKEIHTPPGTLNICAEGALKVPLGKPTAVSGPIYICATKKCAYDNPPRRTNITSSSAPTLITIRDSLNTITSDEMSRLEQSEEFVFL